jgi:hypothetical protein
MLKNNPSIGQQLLDVPMGEMIKGMALSIAEAQLALDSNSIEVAEMMGGLSPVKDTIKDANGNEQEFINFKDSRVFFGKETVRISEAIGLYNTNADQGYRAALDAKIPATAKEPGYDKDVIDVNADPSAASATPGFTPNIPKDINVYYRHKVNATTTNWYTYDSGGDKYVKITGAPNIPQPVPGRQMLVPGTKDDTIKVPQRLSMLELGFSPTFYQFVDTLIQVKLSISMSREGSSSFSYKRDTKSTDRSASFSWRKGLKTNKTVSTTQVNAQYSQKYSYSAEGSSLLQTKLVPIPPPAILEQRIQQQMEIAREEAEIE